MLIRSSKQAASYYEQVKYPILLLTVSFALYCGYTTGWSWFSYHPMSMIVAATTLPPLGAIIKKIGGLENTKLHGNILFMAFLFMAFGYYVIYSNKEMMGKDHLVSTHAQFGLAVFIGFILATLSGFFGLHPTYGNFKRNKNLRFLHKWASRVVILLSWYVCFTGYQKIESNEYYHYAFVGFALLLSPLII